MVVCVMDLYTVFRHNNEAMKRKTPTKGSTEKMKLIQMANLPQIRAFRKTRRAIDYQVVRRVHSKFGKEPIFGFRRNFFLISKMNRVVFFQARKCFTIVF